MTSKSSIAAKALLSLQTGGMYNGIWLSDETVTCEINKTYSAIKKKLVVYHEQILIELLVPEVLVR